MNKHTSIRYFKNPPPEQILRKGSHLLANAQLGPPTLCRQCALSQQNLTKGKLRQRKKGAPKMPKAQKENLMNSVVELGWDYISYLTALSTGSQEGDSNCPTVFHVLPAERFRARNCGFPRGDRDEPSVCRVPCLPSPDGGVGLPPSFQGWSEVLQLSQLFQPGVHVSVGNQDLSISYSSRILWGITLAWITREARRYVRKIRALLILTPRALWRTSPTTTFPRQTGLLSLQQ